MGAVYQAFDHELGVAVAIKVIRPAAQSDATAAKELELRFKRELVLARQVTHKYVVRIHDIGEIDGIKYLTMPYVQGETLAQALRRAGTLPLPRAIQIATQIARGLAAAHEKGVVHRDLKPENIMIEQNSDSPIPGGGGDALIMDFGIARSVQHGATQTAAGSVIGTLEYMAPEQAQGRQVDQRADQYSFGLIFYDMLIGRQRLDKSENPMTELLARMAAPPAPPRSINADIPEPVDHIVTRCLQPSSEARFESTAELVRALGLTPDGHIRAPTDHATAVRNGSSRPRCSSSPSAAGPAGCCRARANRRSRQSWCASRCRSSSPTSKTRPATPSSTASSNRRSASASKAHRSSPRIRAATRCAPPRRSSPARSSTRARRGWWPCVRA